MDEVESLTVADKVTGAAEQFDRDRDGEEEIVLRGGEAMVIVGIVMDITSQNRVTPGH
jgi:hypothetical protein